MVRIHVQNSNRSNLSPELQQQLQQKRQQQQQQQQQEPTTPHANDNNATEKKHSHSRNNSNSRSSNSKPTTVQVQRPTHKGRVTFISATHHYQQQGNINNNKHKNNLKNATIAVISPPTNNPTSAATERPETNRHHKQQKQQQQQGQKVLFAIKHHRPTQLPPLFPAAAPAPSNTPQKQQHEQQKNLPNQEEAGVPAAAVNHLKKNGRKQQEHHIEEGIHGADSQHNSTATGKNRPRCNAMDTTAASQNGQRDRNLNNNTRKMSVASTVVPMLASNGCCGVIGLFRQIYNQWRKSRLSRAYVLVAMLLSTLMHIIDTVSDVLVALFMISNDHAIAGALMFFFMFMGSIAPVVYEITFLERTKPMLILASILQVRIFAELYNFVKVWVTDRWRHADIRGGVRVFEVTFESVPSAVVQLYVVLADDGGVSSLRWFALVTSLLSGLLLVRVNVAATHLNGLLVFFRVACFIVSAIVRWGLLALFAHVLLFQEGVESGWVAFGGAVLLHIFVVSYHLYRTIYVHKVAKYVKKYMGEDRLKHRVWFSLFYVIYFTVSSLFLSQPFWFYGLSSSLQFDDLDGFLMIEILRCVENVAMAVYLVYHGGSGKLGVSDAVFMVLSLLLTVLTMVLVVCEVLYGYRFRRRAHALGRHVNSKSGEGSDEEGGRKVETKAVVAPAAASVSCASPTSLQEHQPSSHVLRAAGKGQLDDSKDEYHVRVEGRIGTESVPP